MVKTHRNYRVYDEIQIASDDVENKSIGPLQDAQKL
jgi:hypothetical protein